MLSQETHFGGGTYLTYGNDIVATIGHGRILTLNPTADNIPVRLFDPRDREAVRLGGPQLILVNPTGYTVRIYNLEGNELHAVTGGKATKVYLVDQGTLAGKWFFRSRFLNEDRNFYRAGALPGIEEEAATTSWDLTPNIDTANDLNFGNGLNYSAGTYTVSFINGAYQDGSGGPWVNCNYWISYNNKKVDIRMPSGACAADGHTAQAGAEAASQGKSITFPHSGGKIAMYLTDANYANNIAGSPNPTFRLQAASSAESCSVYYRLDRCCKLTYLDNHQIFTADNLSALVGKIINVGRAWYTVTVIDVDATAGQTLQSIVRKSKSLTTCPVCLDLLYQELEGDQQSTYIEIDLNVYNLFAATTKRDLRFRFVPGAHIGDRVRIFGGRCLDDYPNCVDDPQFGTEGPGERRYRRTLYDSVSYLTKGPGNYLGPGDLDDPSKYVEVSLKNITADDSPMGIFIDGANLGTLWGLRLFTSD